MNMTRSNVMSLALTAACSIGLAGCSNTPPRSAADSAGEPGRESAPQETVADAQGANPRFYAVRAEPGASFSITTSGSFEQGDAVDADVMQFTLSLMPALSAYDGSYLWHQMFASLAGRDGDGYDRHAVDQAIGVIRGHKVTGVRVRRFTDKQGEVYWQLDVGFDEIPPKEGEARSFPPYPMLDIKLQRIEGELKIKSIARDLC